MSAAAAYAVCLVAIVLLLFVTIHFLKGFRSDPWVKNVLNPAVRQQGFSQIEIIEAGLSERLRIIDLSRPNGIIRALFHREEDGGDLYIGEYHSWGTDDYWQTVVFCISKQLKLPRIRIEKIPKLQSSLGVFITKALKKSVGSNLKPVNGLDPRWENEYAVYFGSGEQEAARKILEPILERMKTGGHVTLDTDRDLIAVTSVDIQTDRIRRKLDAGKLSLLVGLLGDSVRMLK